MRAGRKEGGEGRSFAFAYFALFMVTGVTSPYLQILLRGLGYGQAAVGLFLALVEVVGAVGPLALTLRAESARGRGGSRRAGMVGAALLVLASLPGLVLIRGAAATALFLAVFALGSRSVSPFLDAQAVAFASSTRGLRGGYGALRAVGSAGFICVALALQFVPGFDRSPPGVIAACIGGTTLVFVAAALGLPGARPPADAAGSSPARAARGPAPRAANAVFFLGLAIMGLCRLAMSPISSFLSLYAQEELGMESVSGLWALAAAAEIPLMLLARRIISRTGPMGAVAISTAAVVARLLVYAAFPSPAGVVCAQLLHCLCFGLFQPAAVAFVAERVRPERRATGMAAFTAFSMNLPAMLGSALGGIVIERWGYRRLFLSFTAFGVAALALYALARRSFRGPPEIG